MYIVRAFRVEMKARLLGGLDLLGRQAVGRKTFERDFDYANARHGRGLRPRASELHNKVEPDDRGKKQCVDYNGKQEEAPVAGISSQAPPEGQSEAPSSRLISDIVF
jgi:hypothetical protein